MPGVRDLRGEMTIDEDAGTLTATYDVEYSGFSEAGEPTGTMVADRIEVEPTAP